MSIVNHNYDVIIIGAGCVGSFAAFYLSKYQLSVAVLEMGSDAASGTTNANSGIIHAGHNTQKDTLKAKLVDKGNLIIRQLAPLLNFGFSQCGELVVARNESEIRELLKMKDYAESIGVECEMWDETRLHSEEPNLNETISQALFIPSAGVVNPYEMAVSALNTAHGNGVDVYFGTEVGGIIFNQEKYMISSNRGEFTASIVINAAGLFADRIAKFVDPSTPINIIPRKGEEYILNKDFRNLVKHIIFPLPTKVSKGTLVIPTVDGTIMVGPTAEDITDKTDHGTTQDGLAKIFDQVKQLVPKIHQGMMISSFAGLRAVDITGDFVINESQGFINLAGTQSPGLTASPAIALEAVNFVLKIIQCAEKQQWIYVPLHQKFARVPMDKRQLLVTEDSNHSKIVCQCELVTVADVHNSITDGARTLDGVKIRTRAGMGGCQGGFCTTKIMEILSDRLGVSLEQITKRNTGTQLCFNEIGKQRQEVEDILLKQSTIYHPASKKNPSILCLQEKYEQVYQNMLKDCPIFDIVVFGAGPAGLSAALKAASINKQLSVIIIEKSNRSGGILIQCIHGGFGLKRFNKELTGPEYSELLTNECVNFGASIFLDSFVQNVTRLADDNFQVNCVIGEIGCRKITAKVIINTVGCRERNRFNIFVSGTRPSGVYNAGLAQALINLHGMMPGKKIVILGSGDIGLIMARRVTLEGAHVVGVFDIMPFSAGLKRNIAQCLTDYQIPLHLSHNCVKINGHDRVESVEFEIVDSSLKPIGKRVIVECDCVLLAVGLLPMAPLSVQAGGKLHQRTNAPLVDSFRSLQSKNAFAAGNCVQVHDLADDAAEEGSIAGAAAVSALSNINYKEKVCVIPDSSIGVCVPEIVYKDASSMQQHISIRVRTVLGHIIAQAVSDDVVIGQVEIQEAVPAEMIHIHLDSELLLKVKSNISVITKVISNASEQQSATIKQLTCIVCPKGCNISVKLNDKNDIEEITGNSCQRGALFAKQEHIQPFRVFSSTVKITGCYNISRLPVKLSKPVPRDQIMKVADQIKLIEVKAPIKMGDSILNDICGFKGVNIIACCSANE